MRLAGLCFVEPLPVTASITTYASFTRQYDWTLTKEADRNQVEVLAGDSATFTYEVTATPSRLDRSFKVTGDVTVTNPNARVASAAVTVRAPGGSCTVTGASVTIPASGFADARFTCTFAGATATTAGDVTASVEWSVGQEAGTETASAGFDFAGVQPHLQMQEVWLSDSAPEFTTEHPKDGYLGVRLLAADGPRTFTYTRDLGSNLEAGECGAFPNRATLKWDVGDYVVETVAQADADVEVCALAPAPALTIEKTAAIDPGSILVSGTQVTWTYTATNTGNVDLTGIEVADDRKLDGPVCTVASLPVGASETCTWTGPVFATALALPGGGP